MELPNKFELHYYFTDSSHSMNALVKNKCELEFLALAAEVANILGMPLELDSEALKEGGIKETWKAIGDNSGQIALVISALALIWSVIPKTDQELVDLQKEDIRLSIEQKKLALKKLKIDAQKNKITAASVEIAASIASNSYKVVTRKSNFYKTLSLYEKVTKVGYKVLDEKNKPLSDESLITRDDFSKFIIISQDLKPLRDSSASIEIVAPVLTDGKAKWKGLYEEQHISFAMNDKEFKAKVISRQLSFKNGDGIICVLLIHKKVNELGEVVTSGYSVEVVLNNIHAGITSETPQGKKYKQTKKMADGQVDMFDLNNV